MGKNKVECTITNFSIAELFWLYVSGNENFTCGVRDMCERIHCIDHQSLTYCIRVSTKMGLT